MKITNLTTLEEVTFGNIFLLSTIDWGVVPASHNKTKGFGQIGSTINSTALNTRTVRVVGFIKLDGKEGMERYKAMLSSLINPLHVLQFEYNDRSIRGKPTSTIIPAQERRDNRKYLYKFSFSCECEYPMFSFVQDLRKDVALWLGGFFFPLQIDETEGIEFSIRSQSQIEVFENEGEVPVGMIVRFRATGSVQNPSLRDIDTQEFITIDRTMIAGDEIIINTNFDRIAATLLRGGVETNIINNVRLGSNYSLSLRQGSTVLWYGADTNEEFLEVSIEYSPAFFMPYKGG